MDYQKIYDSIINKAKSENRKKKSGTYYESHHIVPDFQFKNRTRKGPKGHLEGDPNHEDNLVLLTFKEHIICHVLLCKILRKTRYEYSAYSSILLMMNRKSDSSTSIRRSVMDIKGKTKLYVQVREDALKAISKERTGKIVCKNKETGEIVGSLPNDHPKILSGEFVHHTHGIKFSAERRMICSALTAGENNPNYKPLTDEIYKSIQDIINSIDFSYYRSKYKIRDEFIEKFNFLKFFNKISYVWIDNRFGSFDKLIEDNGKKFPVKQPKIKPIKSPRPIKVPKPRIKSTTKIEEKLRIRFGNDIEKINKKLDEYRNTNSKGMSSKFILRFFELDNIEQVYDMGLFKKRGMKTLEEFIEKYGKELGTKKYEKECTMRSDSTSLEHRIKKYGEQKAIEIIEKVRERNRMNGHKSKGKNRK